MRMPGYECEEVAAIASECFRVLESHRCRCSGTSIEQGDFAEHVAGSVLREGDLLTLDCLHEYFHAPLAHNVKAIANIAAREDFLIFVKKADFKKRCQRSQFLAVQQREHGYVPKDI